MNLLAQEQRKKRLVEVMRSFDAAMLATHSAHGIHARPMAIAALEEDGSLVFVTDVASTKVHEIEVDPKVFILMQSRNRFVALTGFARVVDDPGRIGVLWRETWKAWFPKGRTDPSIRLLEVTPIDAELWDTHGIEGLKYAFDAARSYFTGKKPHLDREEHDRVRLS